MTKILQPPYRTLADAQARVDALSVEQRAVLRPQARRVLAMPGYPSYESVYRRADRALKQMLPDVWAFVREAREMSSNPILPIGSEGAWGYLRLTPTILHACCLLDEAQGSVTASPPAPLALDTGALDGLRGGLLEEAIASSQFEGAATTTLVARQMLRARRPPKTTGERMILGNLRMLEWTWEHADEELSLELICELHRVATEDIGQPAQYRPGELRQTDDVVVMEGDQLIHQPPSWQILPAQLEILLRWVQEGAAAADVSRHPFVDACVLHFMIGWLHPFHDGNGRVARALFYWSLFRDGYTAMRFVSLSSGLKAAPGQYVRAYLQTESEPFDLTYFVQHQAAICADELDAFLEGMATRREVVQGIIGHPSFLSLSQAARMLLLVLLEFGLGGFLTADMAAEALSCSRDTARRTLKELEAQGWVRSQRAGRQVQFHALSLAEYQLRLVGVPPRPDAS